jgi:cytoskeletal protein RodZ
MPQTSTPLDSLLVTIVLATLAVGLPIVFVLSIRFLWDRSLNLGRSKELEKLIWQLHRIASALEHQMNLAFPPVQPGTEEPRDLAYLQQIASPAPAASQSVAASSSVSPAAKPQPAQQQPATPEQVAQQTSFPPLVPREPSAEVPRAGVNSMFGL